MPIEIKELHVKITVSEQKPQADQKPGQAADTLLEACVEEVFSIINNKKER